MTRQSQQVPGALSAVNSILSGGLKLRLVEPLYVNT